MAAIKLTKRSLLLIIVFFIVASGVLGVLREVFLKEYEEQYHFWISVLMAAFSVCITMGIVQRFFNKNE